MNREANGLDRGWNDRFKSGNFMAPGVGVLERGDVKNQGEGSLRFACGNKKGCPLL